MSLETVEKLYLDNGWKKESTDSGAVIFVSRASEKVLTTKLSRFTEKKLEKPLCSDFKCLFRKKIRD